MLSIILQSIAIGSISSAGYAKERSIDYPQNVSIEYDASKLYNVSGAYANGTSFATKTTGLFAVYNQQKQAVFCIDPGIPIPDESTPGYEKNPLPTMPDKAKLITVLWNKVGTDMDTQMVAQKMVWEEVNGLSLDKVISPNGTLIDSKGIESKINQVINDYQKKPSFDHTTVKTILGKSTTLSDKNGVNLSEFNEVVKNTANVDYRVSGNQLIITPNANSKVSGELVLQRSEGTGTPVAYKKLGLQTVMAGAIDKPTTYTVKIQVEKNGSLKIRKVDKESGSNVAGTVFHLDFGKILPEKEVTTDKEGIAVLDGIPHGTKVIITEKSVPKPYTIDTTPVTTTIKAGETITVTKKNTREKGQILLDKTGIETGTDLWNENYSLAGNTFAIRKDSLTGAIVQEITTDEKGHAETPKDIANALELGTYYVTETKASNGFVNSFKPIKVELKYANQTVALVVSDVKGQNQEVTGKTLITKEDKETGNKTQGKAEFSGAQYTLFYAKGDAMHKVNDAVKWTDEFKPELIQGTKASNETVTLRIDEKNQIAVKHLAINEYYWQETQAPEGYTLDQTKYPVSIKKIDDTEQNAVITRDVTAKQQVIRFGFDFFKFASSLAGTASTGFNDLTFKITPLKGTAEITGANDEAITGYNEQLGFDGYGKFENLPYGDYLLQEVKAPDGFQKIQPLEIRTTFKENKDDYIKSEYIFTITEKGQKEPIKTVIVPYEKLTNTNFSVNLNRLLLYDLPENEDSLTSLAVWDEEASKEIKGLDNTNLLDKLSYNLHEVKENWYVVAQAIDVVATKAAKEKDDKAKPVVIAETKTTLANKEKTGTWQILHKLTSEQVMNKTIVLFNYVYSSKKSFKAGEAPIAKDDSLTNQAQTVKCTVKPQVSIQTKAHLENGSQTFSYGDVVDMFDDVSINHDVLDGSKESFETILYALFSDGTKKEIWKSGKIDYVVNDKEFTKTVLSEKVDTSKYPKGTSFTFAEINYDKSGEINGKHNEELNEKTQTLKPSDVVNPTANEEKNKLPQTGEKNTPVIFVLGIIILVVVLSYIFYKFYSKKKH
ncbi:LPXTG-domain-containing protein cell wall anchor domain [Enterococcus phoeniculicola]|nr:LPXTG-domain-containing protein cell wall anchor domain [Enterococcus phoeniculicola]